MTVQLLSRLPGVDLTALGDVPVLAVLDRAVPAAIVRRTVVQTRGLESHSGRLPAEVVVAFIVALGLWSRESLTSVFTLLVAGLRERDPRRWLDWRPPAKSSLTEARQRLGVRPMRELFHRLARPGATSATQGAFRFGLRMMAIDGTSLTVPDSEANARAFGRPTTVRPPAAGTAPDAPGPAGTPNDSGPAVTLGAWPILKLVLLVECGTHLICDAVLRPYAASEPGAARRLLRSVTDEMLVLWDRGLHSYAFIQAVRARGAHGLGRVAAPVRLPVEEPLADGSYLTTLYPTERDRRRQTAGLRMRVVEYTIDAPAATRPGPLIRIVTTLLDPAVASAEELAATYHERWEQEGVHDEFKTHQLDRTPAPAVRSRRPAEVVQEVYGVLLAQWAIRSLMREAADQAQIDPDALSFLGSLRIIRIAMTRFHQRLDQPDLSPLCSRPFYANWPTVAARPDGIGIIRGS